VISELAALQTYDAVLVLLLRHSAALDSKHPQKKKKKKKKKKKREEYSFLDGKPFAMLIFHVCSF